MGPREVGFGESVANDVRSETKGRERSERCPERSEGWRERSERVEGTSEGVRKEESARGRTEKRVVCFAHKRRVVSRTQENGSA